MWNKFLIGSLYSLLSSALFAGSASTGGGKFIGTESNPWFLENVQTVTYCIDVDPTAFRPSITQAQQSVRYALDKWIKTFSDRILKDSYYGQGELQPYGDVRLATQKFVEIDCNSTTEKDLRFQFGHLTSDQQKALPNYKDYIGVAVRTDYDLVSLRGRGFIYIAADTGPNRPSESSFAADPWSVDDSGILKAVLLHELGHVFGLRHESGKTNIMSEGFIDMIVHRDFIKVATNRPGIMETLMLKHLNVLNYDPNMLISECDHYSVKALSNLLHLNSGTTCVKLKFSHNDQGSNKLRIRVSSAPSEEGPFYEEGSITSLEGFNGDANPIIEIKISEQQKVFSHLPLEMSASRIWAGYEKVTQRKFTGTYLNDAGEQTSNLFGFIDENGHFQLGGFRNGKIELQIYSN